MKLIRYEYPQSRHISPFDQLFELGAPAFDALVLYLMSFSMRKVGSTTLRISMKMIKIIMPH